MQNHIRLDDLLARDVAACWFEGVAVVQLVCRQLLAPGASGSGFPRSADILVGPGGSITIAGESTGNPVQAAAHVLALMLSGDGPVRLRLAVSHATSTESGYASLAEFSEALAYFERPNPEMIVDALRQRAMVAVPREVIPTKRIDAAPATGSHPAPAPVSAPRQVGRMAVIVTTAAAVVCASVWLVGRDGIQRLRAPDVVATETVEDAAPASRPGTMRATESAAATVAEIASRARTDTARGDAAVWSPSFAPAPYSALHVSARTLPDSYPELSPLVRTSIEPETSQGAIAISGSTGRGDPQGDPEIEPNPDRIYSKADTQVTLPLNVYPTLPAEPPGLDLAGRTMLELTITADGLVERVRLLTTPRNIHEFMFLSAAKAWRFAPARIGDRPVRFRHTIILNAMP
jgi:outer membrane biosynthesis protein TonB